MRKERNILLTGGTGQLGSSLLALPNKKSFQFDVLTRTPPEPSSGIRYFNADLTRIETLQLVGADYDSVVHCASNPRDSEAIDIKGTINLLKRLRGGSINNFIFISIVGVDKSSYEYYLNKRIAEQLVIDSGFPYTILRLTQFHDFVFTRILNLSSRDIIKVPAGLSFQSIDLVDVCREIQGLLVHGPTNGILEIGGPEILEIPEIAQYYQQILAPQKKLTFIPPENEFHKLFTTGINLCPDSKMGRITWMDFLRNKRNEWTNRAGARGSIQGRADGNFR